MGAGKVEFEKEVADLSVQANQPDEERRSRLPTAPFEQRADYNDMVRRRGLEPTQSGLNLNYFRKIASDDPNLALAALRMEIETIVGNLSTGFNVPIEQRSAISRSLDTLREKGAITSQQNSTAKKVIDLCNRAIHGQKIDTTTALTVIDSVSPLLSDYIAWLDWGFSEESA